MVDRFEELLRELGIELGIPLHRDRKGACKLKFNDEFHVQLECDASQDNLLVACFLSDLSPGKYRENILKDALKSNAMPTNGTLAYSDRNNKLVLFSFLPLVPLSGKALADFLALFLEKAKAWKTRIGHG